MLDHPHGEAQEAIDPPHPVGVALGEVVVDGDHVDALAFERVQIGSEGGHEGLALARLHLRDRAAVEGQAADELHVEVPHVEDAAACLARHREGFGQEVVQGLPLGQPLLELPGLGRELRVGERPQRRLQLADPLNDGADALQLPLVLGPDDLCEDGIDQLPVLVILTG